MNKSKTSVYISLSLSIYIYIYIRGAQRHDGVHERPRDVVDVHRGGGPHLLRLLPGAYNIIYYSIV